MRRLLSLGVFCALCMTLALAAVHATAATTSTTTTPTTTTTAAPAAPSITSPGEGAYVTSASPSFTGTGGTNGDPITLNLFAGSTATGLPYQVLSTHVTDGVWTVAPSTNLPDGTYTAQATEGGAASPTANTSQAITFTVFSSTPGLTLTLPSKSISTPAPTFSGTAPTGSADGTTISLTIYAGAGTDGTPLSQLQGPLQADGSFQITVSPGLGNGTYTAVAGQALNTGGNDFSPTLTFSVGASAPALTITNPAAGGVESETSVSFSGAAGTNYGDDQGVHVTLFAGRTTGGKDLGDRMVTPSGGAWQTTWPTRLALGTYTVEASQADIIGQLTTVVHTFTVAPPGVMQGKPAISAKGVVAVRVACPAGTTTCTGDVLVVTQKILRPISGGPAGALRLLFRHYKVNGGASLVFHAQLGRAQLNALKRAGAQKLVVTTVYALGSKLAETRITTPAVKVAARLSSRTG